MYFTIDQICKINILSALSTSISVNKYEASVNVKYLSSDAKQHDAQNKRSGVEWSGVEWSR